MIPGVVSCVMVLLGSEEDRGGGDLLIGWEGSTIFGPATLSNSDRTISNSLGGRVGVIAKNLRSSGKWYFEIIHTAAANEPNNRIGIATSVWLHNNIVGEQTSGAAASFHGFSYNNGYTGAGNMGAPVPSASGAVTQIAIDLDSGRVWVGVNGGWKWSGNPTTNTNPIFTGITGTWGPALSIDQVAVWSVTLREMSSQFTYTPPAGFSPWSGS